MTTLLYVAWIAGGCLIVLGCLWWGIGIILASSALAILWRMK